MSFITDRRGGLKAVNYELFILAVSALMIVNLFLTRFASSERVVAEVFFSFNIGLSIVLLVDFLRRLVTAPSRRAYFFQKGGWLDLLGSAGFTFLGLLRLYRMIVVVRELRQMGRRNVADELLTFRAGGALFLVVFLGILLLELSSATMVGIESDNPEANIQTASDAIWWAYVTITTVGYGDRYPVTNLGRIVGVGVMTLGVGLFSVLTGYLANSFLGDRDRLRERQLRRRAPADGQSAELEQLQALQEVRQLLLEQQQANSVLQARLGRIEALLVQAADTDTPDTTAE